MPTLLRPRPKCAPDCTCGRHRGAPPENRGVRPILICTQCGLPRSTSGGHSPDLGSPCRSCAAKNRLRPTVEERFWEKVEKTAGCWLWTGATTPSASGPYSAFRGNAGNISAHRYAYQALVGTVPDGLELDHLCRNTLCVNPAHLEPVSHQVNILRGTGCSARNARRTHCPQGHEYTPENTYSRPGKTERQCRVCMAVRSKAQSLKRRLSRAKS
jgi:hypothetical protein